MLRAHIAIISRVAYSGKSVAIVKCVAAMNGGVSNCPFGDLKGGMEGEGQRKRGLDEQQHHCHIQNHAYKCIQQSMCKYYVATRNTCILIFLTSKIIVVHVQLIIHNNILIHGAYFLD